MRRINASRPITGRRSTRRRRRAIAPAVPMDQRRLKLRTLVTPVIAGAGLFARQLLGFGHSTFATFKSIPFGAAARRITEQVRAAHSTLRAGLSAGRAFTWACLSVGRALVWAWLLTGLMLTREWLARGAATLPRAGNRARRWIAAVRLPEIPGGDPVRFGAGVGVAIIAGAGLAVLVGTELRENGADSQAVGELSDRDWDRLSRDWQLANPAADDAARADNEAVLPQTVRGLTDGIVEPAPVIAAGSGPADQDEDLAVALPLLDIPDDGGRHLALRRPGRPPLPVPRPPHDARPPAPAAPPQWLANAVQTPYRPGKNPMIAIVIDDAGVAQARTARAIELPAPLTIAFIPYSSNLKQQSRQARQNGHELLLHIPMEADSNAVDPGPNALLTSLDGDEIMRRFRWALSRFDGYAGVNNHMGSKFMARADLVEPLLAEMHARGLMFLDSRTDHTTVGADLARGMDLPHASRQVFLDNDLNADKIAAQLAELERVARRRGHAIAIGHPHDVTVDVLAKWIPEARARGFELVPVSAIVKLDYGSGVGSQLAAAAGGGEPDGLLGSTQ